MCATAVSGGLWAREARFRNWASRDHTWGTTDCRGSKASGRKFLNIRGILRHCTL